MSAAATFHTKNTGKHSLTCRYPACNQTTNVSNTCVTNTHSNTNTHSSIDTKTETHGIEHAV